MSPPSPAPIFRPKALDRLASPDRLDQRVALSSRRGWLFLSGASLLTLVILWWSLSADVPVRVGGAAILVRPGGVYNLYAPGAGRIDELLVDEGDTVRAGQIVARLQPANGQKKIEIPARQSGRILEAFVDPFQEIERGQSLFSLEVGDGKTPLLGVIYVSPLDGRSVSPGMEVRLSPSTVRPEQHGFLRGKVVSVSAYPVSQAGMMRAYHNQNLANKLAGNDSPVEVVAELFAESQNPSGYAWTSGRGPSQPLVSGTLCRGNITLESRRPIELALPSLGARR